MTKELTDIQKQIWGCVSLGNYNEAIKLCADGDFENTRTLTEAVFKDAYNEAIKQVVASAAEDLNETRKYWWKI